MWGVHELFVTYEFANGGVWGPCGGLQPHPFRGQAHTIVVCAPHHRPHIRLQWTPVGRSEGRARLAVPQPSTAWRDLVVSRVAQKHHWSCLQLWLLWIFTTYEFTGLIFLFRTGSSWYSHSCICKSSTFFTQRFAFTSKGITRKSRNFHPQGSAVERR